MRSAPGLKQLGGFVLRRTVATQVPVGRASRGHVFTPKIV
jgi:hypothetical protein